MYFYEGPVTGQRGGNAETTMNMVLRPGEAIVWRWGQLDPRQVPRGLDDHAHVSIARSTTACGSIVPDFSKEPGARGPPAWRTSPPAPTAWPPRRARRARSSGRCAALTCLWAAGSRRKARTPSSPSPLDGKTWQAVKDNLDKFFSTVGPARYEYQLKCQLEGPARLRRLAIINDLQMAPLALPEMVVGENTFTYSDQSAGERKVRITHHWVERSTSKPPQAPPGPDLPARWRRSQRHRHRLPVDGRPRTPTAMPSATTTSSCPAAPTCGGPLSMCFYKLISRTADVVREKGKDGQGQDSPSSPNTPCPSRAC